MGKIVKFCASCEESFAEKFSFCPNCASELSPFEMKPVDEETPIVVEDSVGEIETVELVNKFETRDLTEEMPPVVQEQPVDEIEEQAVFEPVSFMEDEAEGFDKSAEKMISDDVQEIQVEKPNLEEEVFVAKNTPEIKEESDNTMATMFSAEDADESFERNYGNAADDGGFHVTVVSERGGKVRNGLLLAAFSIVIFGFVGIVGYSLFSNLDDVASLTDNDRLIALLNENPIQIEEEELEKEDDEGGGGGGGGKNQKTPASRGELPNQTETIQPPPQVLPKLKDPSLAQINYTKGPDTRRERSDVTGIPGALDGKPSSGTGSGGGIGDGDGAGVGSGFGDGEGSGSGGGRGGGSGGGVGSGNGPGGGSGPKPPAQPNPPPPPPAGPTVGIKILSKPKPGYTDAARQNNVRGVVRVKVTFLASGRIGGVAVVSGLPHGLTEKALAAARQIRFTPPMRSGVPYSVKKTVVFNFNIY